MAYLQKNCVLFFLSLLIFNQSAISAEPLFIVNIPQYQTSGEISHTVGPLPETVTTGFLTCTDPVDTCVDRTFQEWVQDANAEGHTVIDNREYNCCAVLFYRWSNLQFVYVGGFINKLHDDYLHGTMRYSFDLFMQWSDYDTHRKQIPGVYHENTNNYQEQLSIKIQQNCPTPPVP